MSFVDTPYERMLPLAQRDRAAQCRQSRNRQVGMSRRYCALTFNDTLDVCEITYHLLVRPHAQHAQHATRVASVHDS